MGVLITIENLYENGVCDEYNIYSGTTYNINDAVSMGSHELPYEWDGGDFNGNLYVFVEHCDGHTSPPPNNTPIRQGGFQVKLITIDCEPTCNINSIIVSSTPAVTSTPASTPSSSPAVTSTPASSPIPGTPQPTNTPESTPSITSTPDPTGTPAVSSTPQPTQTITPTPTNKNTICVTNFGVSMLPCVGGTKDDHMEAEVTLSDITPIDASFTLEVGYIPGTFGDCNNPLTYTTIDVTVYAGTDNGLVTCPDAQFIDETGATICSVNITYGDYEECNLK